VWCGHGSPTEEREGAHNVARQLMALAQVSGNPIEVNETIESDEFWQLLGGKQDYATSVYLKNDVKPREPRLFQCNDSTGVFTVTEMYNFCQDDLLDEDVFILDTFSEVYVWIGPFASESEKTMAMETADEYVSRATDGRDPDTPVYRVEASREPLMFTCHFIGWDAKKMKYDLQTELLASQQIEKNRPVTATENIREILQDKEEVSAEPEEEGDKKKKKKKNHKRKGTFTFNGNEIPYEMLMATVRRTSLKKLPKDVDLENREKYMSDEEFRKVLGFSKDEFYAMPKWKQLNKKKATKLF